MTPLIIYSLIGFALAYKQLGDVADRELAYSKKYYHCLNQRLSKEDISSAQNVCSNSIPADKTTTDFFLIAYILLPFGYFLFEQIRKRRKK